MEVVAGVVAHAVFVLSFTLKVKSAKFAARAFKSRRCWQKIKSLKTMKLLDPPCHAPHIGLHDSKAPSLDGKENSQRIHVVFS